MSDTPSADFLALHEIVAAARGQLDDNMWGYVIGGAETETTLRRNRLALDSLALRPRVLRDVSTVDCRGRLLGRETRLPVFLAPLAALENLHPEGSVAAGRAAAGFGVPLFLSSLSQPGLEDTARGAPGVNGIYQLYVRGDDAWIDAQIERLLAAGFRALCLTVDTAVYSRRERDVARRFVKPWRERATGLEFQAAFSWRQVERIKRTCSVPLILKGIATAEDAAQACELGVDVIYASNHGGRQLDHGCAALDFLPEVVAAVNGRAPVLVDGGVCRGTDVIKALALGAAAVGLGRMTCYGLAAAGSAGVVRMLELLEDEMRIALALLGATDLAALGPHCLSPARAVTPSDPLSAFPFLDSVK